jgi:two-component system sensor histidine kinase KdpD
MWNPGRRHKDGMRTRAATLDDRAREAHVAPMAHRPPSPDSPEPVPFALAVRRYAEALMMVAASTLVGLFVAPRWGTAAVDMLYLPAVLAAAVLYGLRPALLAALGSALAYNFFFTEPIHTFRIDSPSDIVTVFVLFVVAVVASQLAASIRTQARLAAGHAARNATIAGFARRLLSCSTEAEIGTVACGELASLFDCNAVMAGGQPEPSIIARTPGAAAVTPSDLAAAAWVLAAGEPAGRGVARTVAGEWQFHPVKSESGTIAAIGLARDDGHPPVLDEQLPLLNNLLDQVALALERARLEAQSRDVSELRERDRLRAALLSSVGHDLRTPLTAIIAAAAELRQAGDTDNALVATVSTEAAKLERYISNLLDMARIESGSVGLKLEAVDLVDAVSAALRDLRPTLHGHAIDVALADDLPLVRADPDLLHHCLINLLDNAGRHSRPDSPIHIGAKLEAGDLLLSVEDEGPGLPDAQAPFETFVNIGGSDRKGGTGLGLAIVKSFAAAMGIAVEAGARPNGDGAAFTLRFPERLTLSAVAAGDAE